MTTKPNGGPEAWKTAADNLFEKGKREAELTEVLRLVQEFINGSMWDAATLLLARTGQKILLVGADGGSSTSVAWELTGKGFQKRVFVSGMAAAYSQSKDVVDPASAEEIAFALVAAEGYGRFTEAENVIAFIEGKLDEIASSTSN